MIKINLLPVRAAKKKETAKQQLTIYFASIIGLLAVAVAVYVFLQAKISSTREEITSSENKIEELKVKIGKINDLKKLKDEVRKKLDVLTLLRKGKVGPVHRLATLSEAAPDRLWLTKYAETANDVTISGIAFNEELIASFMKGLEASSDYENIELVVSEQTDMKGIKLKKFDLKMKLKSIKLS